MYFSHHNNTSPSNNRKKLSLAVVSIIDSSSGMGHKRRTGTTVPKKPIEEEKDNVSVAVSCKSGGNPATDVRVPSGFLTPLPHLKGRERMRYTATLPIEAMDLFQVALELYNRKGVRPLLNVAGEIAPEICEYFYECVGRMKRLFQWCVQCGDKERDKLGYDYYYVNLVEIAQSRGARCSGCMYRLLKRHIRGTETALRQELRYLRVEQPNGVLVDPFLITCGH